MASQEAERRVALVQGKGGAATSVTEIRRKSGQASGSRWTEGENEYQLEWNEHEKLHDPSPTSDFDAGVTLQGPAKAETKSL
mmetsp:Transcript_24617/g.57168  ORF Transcript_24617/g.57168 Transcript_24617/m.57168 type:complete len:82 (+) Transcript_24617:251-496(+)